jgi:hypothetical protein
MMRPNCRAAPEMLMHFVSVPELLPYSPSGLSTGTPCWMHVLNGGPEVLVVASERVRWACLVECQGFNADSATITPSCCFRLPFFDKPQPWQQSLELPDIFGWRLTLPEAFAKQESCCSSLISADLKPRFGNTSNPRARVLGVQETDNDCQRPRWFQ